MRDTGEETRRRSKQQAGETPSTGVDMRPDRNGQTTEFYGWHSLLDMVGQLIGSIGDALEGLDFGDISFD